MRFVSNIHDLTHIKQQEAELARSQKLEALGKLTSGIAHDNNNVLGIILGFSDILYQSLDKSPNLQKYAGNIRSAAERGAKLTNKLLNYSRKKPQESKAVDVNHLLNGQMDMLQKTLTIKVKIEYELETDVWPIYVDDNDLEDALLNLCINAMHAMENTESANLTVQTENLVLSDKHAEEIQIRAGEYVKISITNNGCGMPVDIQSKVFDPFFSTKGNKGTGLGLAQVFAFVTRSAGHISITSQPLKGTTVSIYLPRSSTPFAEALPTKEGSGILQTPLNILMVDDETLVREFCCDVLLKHGHQVTEATDMQCALKQLQQANVDVVISDIVMPNGDGYMLAKEVKQQYPHIRVLLITGFDSVNESHNTNLPILKKPFTEKQLIDALNTTLTTALGDEVDSAEVCINKEIQ